MASYKIEWKKSAESDLTHLEKKLLPRIFKKVESLVNKPLPPTAKKLRGSESLYRLRIGDYRVIYQVSKLSRLVTVYYIRHRKEVYKKTRGIKG